MAIPTFVAAGTQGSGAGAGISLGLPAGTIDGDCHVLAIGTYNQAITLYGGKEEGFTAISGGMVGTGTGGSAGSVRITLFERIRGAGATNAPVVGDSGTIQFARIFAFRWQAGSNYRAVVNTNTQAAGTAGSATGGTTATYDENLICAFIMASGPDALESADLSSPANASLTSVTERADLSTDEASGGLLGLITGEQASAGATGDTTYTSATSTAKAHVVLSITSGAGGGGGGTSGAGVNRGLVNGGTNAGVNAGLVRRSMVKVNGIWQQTKEIIRPRVVVPGFSF